MKIKELSDEEILNFLMTSEFEDNYSPDELKYLLLKWRYFYRLFHGKYERLRDDNISDISMLKSEVQTLNNNIINLQVDVASRDNLIDSMKNRKLTWKERLTGKIITKEDEDK
jgi:hypothetical protein